MSKGFKAHPDNLAKAAKEAHGHAKRVESHSSNLDSKTRDRLLGKGKYGMIMQKAIRPIIDSMITDMSKSMARGHRSIGHGLDITRKNIDDAEKAIRRDLRRHQDERDAIKLKPGQRALSEDDLRDKHGKRVAERVEGLRRQGHGPQRHLDPTDDMLKERLGTPSKIRDGNGNALQDAHGNQRFHRNEDGYLQTENKIDPAHGPNAKERLQGDDLYMDAENPAKKHKCDAFSTGFRQGEDEAFMHADQYARTQLDPSKPNGLTVEFSPNDAWGSSESHHDRFRGFFIDRNKPFLPDGSVNYRPVDFQDAKIVAVYRPDGNGGHKLLTMFPQPVRGRNL